MYVYACRSICIKRVLISRTCKKSKTEENKIERTNLIKSHMSLSVCAIELIVISFLSRGECIRARSLQQVKRYQEIKKYTSNELHFLSHRHHLIVED